MMGNMLVKTNEEHLKTLTKRYPMLKEIEDSIIRAYMLFEECYLSGGKMLIAGNGGSAADAEHIVGELMKGFKLSRTLEEDFKQKLCNVDPIRGKELGVQLQGGLPAIALNSHQALSSAYLNDVDGAKVYAQQVNGYGVKGDVLLAISTSGNSRNVIYASIVAKAKGMKVIGFTGESGGELSNLADITVKVPEKETYMIQELHLPIYHCWCLMLEERFFAKKECGDLDGKICIKTKTIEYINN